jgi:phage terminase small subunit
MEDQPAAPELSAKHQRFVDEYLVDLNATQAYIRAGYEGEGAGSSAFKLLQNPEIAAAIEKGREKLSDMTGITPANVLKEWWKIVQADPNELVEHQRGCCRHCYGEGFRYQYTEGEMRKRRTAHDRHKPKPGRGKQDKADAEAWDADGAFELEGGIGFDPTRKPNPECPECVGDGVQRIVPKDTRLLSPEARALFAGVKVTKDGYEIKTHSKDRALENIAKHLGMFVERKALVNTDGEDIQFAPIMFVPVEPKPRDD